MHDAAYQYVARALETLPPPRRVADLGGRNVNGSIRPLLPKDARYIVVDLRYARDVDYVADAAEWGEPDAYDLVICTEVFEHTEKAAAICANAYRILRDGGAFIVTTAYTGRKPHSAIDGGPLRGAEFYRNVSAADLTQWLAGFSVIEVEIDEAAHDIRACAVK